MGILEQKRTKSNQVFPFPENGRTVEENPPCFVWLKEADCVRYSIEVRHGGETVFQGTTKENFLISSPLPVPGEYEWTLTGEGANGEIHSRTPWTFTLSEKAVSIRRTGGREFYDKIPDERPRHLFSVRDIPALLAERGEALRILKNTADNAKKNGVPAAPMFHRDERATPYREYFGRLRDFCDRDLVACSLAYALTGDEEAGEHGLDLFLTFCGWNPAGPCSLTNPAGDEIGLSMARCLPMCFDMLWPLMNSQERLLGAETVRAYGEQCYRRIRALDFTANPGESHSGRLPAYLGEAAAVLKGTGVQSKEEAILWLDCALSIYGGMFPFYGTPDGGWAEGAFYATSYTRWYLPFFSLTERVTGCRFLDRPFYQRVTHFFLHFASPFFENHPFGDGYWCHPEDAEWPGFFAQNPLRLYADRFGPELAVRRAHEEEKKEKTFLLHLADAFLPKGGAPEVSLTGEAENVRAFPDAGFASLHTDLAHPEKDFALLCRASRFGSGSHRHPDEGSFALFFRGVALISPSGYFGRGYGTEHHRKWCNSTAAHNAILVDGAGQEAYSFRDTGRIAYVADFDSHKIVRMDCTEAYPCLTRWVRTMILSEAEGEHRLTVTDEIRADHPVEVTWPLHALSLPKKEGNGIVVERGGVRMTGTPLSGGLILDSILDEFPIPLNAGVPEEYAVEMPPQYHVFWKTDKKAAHFITMEFRVRDAD